MKNVEIKQYSQRRSNKNSLVMKHRPLVPSRAIEYSEPSPVSCLRF